MYKVNDFLTNYNNISFILDFKKTKMSTYTALKAVESFNDGARLTDICGTIRTKTPSNTTILLKKLVDKGLLVKTDALFFLTSESETLLADIDSSITEYLMTGKFSFKM